jgi:hypothetical protein
MTFSKSIIVVFLICTIYSCNSEQNESVTYVSNSLDGLTLYLSGDEFAMVYIRGEQVDSMKGTIQKFNDTLVLTYKPKSDTSNRSGEKIGGFRAIGDVFSNRSLLVYPGKLLQQGAKLIYLDPLKNSPMVAGYEQLFFERIR